MSLALKTLLKLNLMSILLVSALGSVPVFSQASAKSDKKVLDARSMAIKKDAIQHYVRGKDLHRRKLYRGAIREYKKALSIYSNLPNVKKHLKWAKRDLRRKVAVDSAKLQTLDQIVSKAKSFYKKGQQMEEKQKPFEAALAYKQAMKLIPTYPEAKWSLQQVQKKVKRSLIPKGSALRKKRKAQKPLTQKKLRRKKTSKKEMVASIREARGHKGDSNSNIDQSPMQQAVQNHFLTGTQAFDNADYTVAIQEFELILEFLPNHPKANFKLEQAKKKLAQEIENAKRKAEIAHSRGDAVGEVKAIRDLAQIDPDNAELQQKWKDAKKANKAMVSQLYRKGVSLYAAGKYQDALQSWELVMDLDPKHKKTISSIKKAREKLLILSSQDDRIPSVAMPTPNK